MNQQRCWAAVAVPFILAVLWLSACGTAPERQTVLPSGHMLYKGQPWHAGVLDNQSGSAVAPHSLQAILESVLRIHGIDLQSPETEQPIGTDGQAVSRYSGVASARQAQIAPRVVFGGVIRQWHYESDPVPQPVIHLTLQARDGDTQELLWSDTIKKKGKRRENITALAYRMVSELTSRLPLESVVDGQAETEIVAAVKSQPLGRSQTVMTLPALGMRHAQRTLAKSSLSHLHGNSIAFYYGSDPAAEILSQFDRVVLEPDHMRAEQLQELASRGAELYAYLSVGEVGPERAYARLIRPAWVLGKNPNWDSQVLDLSSTAVRSFLLKRGRALAAQGYNGLFLDTMDSFNLVAHSEADRRRQTEGLKELVQSLDQIAPGFKLISNRGFEVLDQLTSHIDAVVAESLYAGWNNSAGQYTSVSEPDRQWLLAQLRRVRDELGLDVIVLDYVPPEKRALAREVAASIAAHGFIPWVANPELNAIGIGALEVMPRQVLLVYDGAAEGYIDESRVHRYLAMPLEYLGYVPEYLDISKEPLPQGILRGRYAGIATWFHTPSDQELFRSWLLRQMRDRVPLALMGGMPVVQDEVLLQLMGVVTGPLVNPNTAERVVHDAMYRPERSMSPRIGGFNAYLKNGSSSNTVHLSYRDASGAQTDAVLTGDFGGYALAPAVLSSGLDYNAYWQIDPFAFLEKALKLPRIPQPDVTSENGKRLWLAHIDGDAMPSWAEMPGARRLGAEVIYDEILTAYPLPHTISVVEGEMVAFGEYKDRRQRMFDIARKTFRLPYVELATHTYSHPFFWRRLGQHRDSGKYNLKIPGYQYSPQRDIGGSVAFIDRELAPPGKKTAVMLWSGDALPRYEDLAVARDLGLPNMNGGLTVVTENKPTMTLVSPMARPVRDLLQVYAPIMNENVYTNDWMGPFDGFRHVKETLAMTEHPRRLKPINIYYHFYSGTKISAMRALREIYDWTLQQDIFPLYVSDYSVKVPDYRHAGVARYLDGRWRLSGLGHVRSIRLLDGGQWPELDSSQGVVGARALHDGLYLHTSGVSTVEFDLSSQTPRLPYLISSNGQVRHWQLGADRLQFRIAGYVPLVVELGGGLSPSCVLTSTSKTYRAHQTTRSSLVFRLNEKDSGHVTLYCPA